MLHSNRSLAPESTSTFYYPSVGNSARHHQDSFRSVGSSFRDNDLFIDDLMYATSSQNMGEAIKLPIPGPPPKVTTDYVVTESRLRSLEAELSRMRKALANNHVQASSSSRLKSTSPVEDLAMVGCSPTGCLANLNPVNRTGGLLAKTLQRLRFPGFGKAKATSAGAKQEPVISAPIVESVERGLFRGSFPDVPSRYHEQANLGRRVGRTDSMPQHVRSDVKLTRHVRHKSIS